MTPGSSVETEEAAEETLTALLQEEELRRCGIRPSIGGNRKHPSFQRQDAPIGQDPGIPLKDGRRTRKDSKKYEKSEGNEHECGIHCLPILTTVHNHLWRSNAHTSNLPPLVLTCLTICHINSWESLGPSDAPAAPKIQVSGAHRWGRPAALGLSTHPARSSRRGAVVPW